MNILAIGAHPDDVDIGCGGTMSRFRQAGERVVSCVVTDGRAHPTGNPAQVAAMRKEEASSAAAEIGAQLVWLGFPDGGLRDTPETRQAFVQLMVDVSPDLIITHPPEDYHSDHVTTSRLVMATVQMAWAPPPGVSGAPVRKPVPVAFMAPANGINFIPEEYVDVSEVWDTKLAMIAHHRSQYLEGPDYGAAAVQEPLEQYYLFRINRVLGEFYGLQAWCRYAEGFRWWRAADRIVARRLLP